jgi:hypothetical protein
MAHIERKDITLSHQMDELEQKLSLLKIQYEKYFSGIERFEPMKDRDNLKRMVRDLLDVQMKSPAQRFRFQQIKARVQSYELYWTRNLAMIERGTHPKMKFRADLKAPRPNEPQIEELQEVEPMLSTEQEAVLRRRQEQQEKEERALKLDGLTIIRLRGIHNAATLRRNEPSLQVFH